MASTIDTSDGKVILNGGAVALPTSATTVSSPADGSLRYNSTNDEIEWFSPTASGAWYTVGAITYKAGETLTADTTLTHADIGSFITCNKSTTLNITLPAVSGLKSFTGFLFDAQQSFITFHPAGSDTVNGLATYTIPKGSHAMLINNGVSGWFITENYNPYATVTPYVFESVANNITAAGTNQSTAFVLGAKYNTVSTVAAGTGISLPAFINIGVGVEFFVVNNGANALKIYPQTGAAIDSLATNAPFTLPVGGKASFVATTATAWESFALSSYVANNSIISNISGGSAVSIANTLTAIIDSAISNTEGSILYRGGSNWLALAPGSANQFLQTLGTGGTPQWANTVATVNTGTGLTGGPITSTGTIAFATAGDSTILANITGGSSAPSPTTLSGFLDHVLGTTQGSIIYRGSSTWTTLVPGTTGQFLQTQGASANPQWSGTSTTQTAGDNTTNIATTAFVTAATGNAATVTTTGGSTTLTAAQYGVATILITGALGSNATLVVPNSGKWSVSNRTSGAFTVTVKTLSGTGATITQGAAATVIADGTNCVLAFTDLSPIIDSAIGNTQGDILYRSATGWSVLAPGTSGYVLETQGASANPQWTSVTAALGYTPVATNSRIAEYTFIGTNTGATAGRLTTNGSTAGGSNTGAIAINSAAIFDIELIAYDTTSPAAVTFTLSAGLISCGSTLSTTTISGSPTFTAGTATSGAPTISTPPTVAADTTNGGFDIEFTPPSANTDTWHITARTKLTIVS